MHRPCGLLLVFAGVVGAGLNYLWDAKLVHDGADAPAITAPAIPPARIESIPPKEPNLFRLNAPLGQPPRLFGQRALLLGLLSSYQARILIAYQRTLQKKLGQYFVDRGYLTREEMELLAADQNHHNSRFPVVPVADWRSS